MFTAFAPPSHKRVEPAGRNGASHPIDGSKKNHRIVPPGVTLLWKLLLWTVAHLAAWLLQAELAVENVVVVVKSSNSPADNNPQSWDIGLFVRGLRLRSVDSTGAPISSFVSKRCISKQVLLEGVRAALIQPPSQPKAGDDLHWHVRIDQHVPPWLSDPDTYLEKQRHQLLALSELKISIDNLDVFTPTTAAVAVELEKLECTLHKESLRNILHTHRCFEQRLAHVECAEWVHVLDRSSSDQEVQQYAVLTPSAIVLYDASDYYGLSGETFELAAARFRVLTNDTWSLTSMCGTHELIFRATSAASHEQWVTALQRVTNAAAEKDEPSSWCADNGKSVNDGSVPAERKPASKRKCRNYARQAAACVFSFFLRATVFLWWLLSKHIYSFTTRRRFATKDQVSDVESAMCGCAISRIYGAIPVLPHCFDILLRVQLQEISVQVLQESYAYMQNSRQVGPFVPLLLCKMRGISLSLSTQLKCDWLFPRSCRRRPSEVDASIRVGVNFAMNMLEAETTAVELYGTERRSRRVTLLDFKPGRRDSALIASAHIVARCHGRSQPKSTPLNEQNQIFVAGAAWTVSFDRSHTSCQPHFCHPQPLFVSLPSRVYACCNLLWVEHMVAWLREVERTPVKWSKFHTSRETLEHPRAVAEDDSNCGSPSAVQTVLMRLASHIFGQSRGPSPIVDVKQVRVVAPLFCQLTPKTPKEGLSSRNAYMDGIAVWEGRNGAVYETLRCVEATLCGVSATTLDFSPDQGDCVRFGVNLTCRRITAGLTDSLRLDQSTPTTFGRGCRLNSAQENTYNAHLVSIVSARAQILLPQRLFPPQWLQCDSENASPRVVTPPFSAGSQSSLFGEAAFDVFCSVKTLQIDVDYEDVLIICFFISAAISLADGEGPTNSASRSRSGTSAARNDQKDAAQTTGDNLCSPAWHVTVQVDTDVAINLSSGGGSTSGVLARHLSHGCWRQPSSGGTFIHEQLSLDDLCQLEGTFFVQILHFNISLQGRSSSHSNSGMFDMLIEADHLRLDFEGFDFVHHDHSTNEVDEVLLPGLSRRHPCLLLKNASFSLRNTFGHGLEMKAGYGSELSLSVTFYHDALVSMFAWVNGIIAIFSCTPEDDAPVEVSFTAMRLDIFVASATIGIGTTANVSRPLEHRRPKTTSADDGGTQRKYEPINESVVAVIFFERFVMEMDKHALHPVVLLAPTPVPTQNGGLDIVISLENLVLLDRLADFRRVPFMDAKRAMGTNVRHSPDSTRSAVESYVYDHIIQPICLQGESKSTPPPKYSSRKPSSVQLRVSIAPVLTNKQIPDVFHYSPLVQVSIYGVQVHLVIRFILETLQLVDEVILPAFTIWNVDREAQCRFRQNLASTLSMPLLPVKSARIPDSHNDDQPLLVAPMDGGRLHLEICVFNSFVVLPKSYCSQNALAVRLQDVICYSVQPDAHFTQVSEDNAARGFIDRYTSYNARHFVSDCVLLSFSEARPRRSSKQRAEMRLVMCELQSVFFIRTTRGTEQRGNVETNDARCRRVYTSRAKVSSRGQKHWRTGNLEVVSVIMPKINTQCAETAHFEQNAARTHLHLWWQASSNHSSSRHQDVLSCVIDENTKVAAVLVDYAAGKSDACTTVVGHYAVTISSPRSQLRAKICFASERDRLFFLRTVRSSVTGRNIRKHLRAANAATISDDFAHLAHLSSPAQTTKVTSRVHSQRSGNTTRKQSPGRADFFRGRGRRNAVSQHDRSALPKRSKTVETAAERRTRKLRVAMIFARWLQPVRKSTTVTPHDVAAWQTQAAVLDACGIQTKRHGGLHWKAYFSNLRRSESSDECHKKPNSALFERFRAWESRSHISCNDDGDLVCAEDTALKLGFHNALSPLQLCWVKMSPCKEVSMIPSIFMEEFASHHRDAWRSKSLFVMPLCNSFSLCGTVQINSLAAVLEDASQSLQDIDLYLNFHRPLFFPQELYHFATQLGTAGNVFSEAFLLMKKLPEVVVEDHGTMAIRLAIEKAVLILGKGFSPLKNPSCLDNGVVRQRAFRRFFEQLTVKTTSSRASIGHICHSIWRKLKQQSVSTQLQPVSTHEPSLSSRQESKHSNHALNSPSSAQNRWAKLKMNLSSAVANEATQPTKHLHTNWSPSQVHRSFQVDIGNFKLALTMNSSSKLLIKSNLRYVEAHQVLAVGQSCYFNAVMLTSQQTLPHSRRVLVPAIVAQYCLDGVGCVDLLFSANFIPENYHLPGSAPCPISELQSFKTWTKQFASESSWYIMKSCSLHDVQPEPAKMQSLHFVQPMNSSYAAAVRSCVEQQQRESQSKKRSHKSSICLPTDRAVSRRERQNRKHYEQERQQQQHHERRRRSSLARAGQKTETKMLEFTYFMDATTSRFKAKVSSVIVWPSVRNFTILDLLEDDCGGQELDCLVDRIISDATEQEIGAHDLYVQLPSRLVEAAGRQSIVDRDAEAFALFQSKIDKPSSPTESPVSIQHSALKVDIQLSNTIGCMTTAEVLHHGPRDTLNVCASVRHLVSTKRSTLERLPTLEVAFNIPITRTIVNVALDVSFSMARSAEAATSGSDTTAKETSNSTAHLLLKPVWLSHNSPVVQRVMFTTEPQRRRRHATLRRQRDQPNASCFIFAVDSNSDRPMFSCGRLWLLSKIEIAQSTFSSSILSLVKRPCIVDYSTASQLSPTQQITRASLSIDDLQLEVSFPDIILLSEMMDKLTSADRDDTIDTPQSDSTSPPIAQPSPVFTCCYTMVSAPSISVHFVHNILSRQLGELTLRNVLYESDSYEKPEVTELPHAMVANSMVTGSLDAKYCHPWMKDVKEMLLEPMNFELIQAKSVSEDRISNIIEELEVAHSTDFPSRRKLSSFSKDQAAHGNGKSGFDAIPQAQNSIVFRTIEHKTIRVNFSDAFRQVLDLCLYTSDKPTSGDVASGSKYHVTNNLDVPVILHCHNGRKILAFPGETELHDGISQYSSTLQQRTFKLPRALLTQLSSSTASRKGRSRFVVEPLLLTEGETILNFSPQQRVLAPQVVHVNRTQDVVVPLAIITATANGEFSTFSESITNKVISDAISITINVDDQHTAPGVVISPNYFLLNRTTSVLKVDFVVPSTAPQAHLSGNEAVQVICQDPKSQVIENVLSTAKTLSVPIHVLLGHGCVLCRPFEGSYANEDPTNVLSIDGAGTDDTSGSDCWVPLGTARTLFKREHGDEIHFQNFRLKVSEFLSKTQVLRRAQWCCKLSHEAWTGNAKSPLEQQHAGGFADVLQQVQLRHVIALRPAFEIENLCPKPFFYELTCCAPTQLQATDDDVSGDMHRSRKDAVRAHGEREHKNNKAMLIATGVVCAGGALRVHNVYIGTVIYLKVKFDGCWFSKPVGLAVCRHDSSTPPVPHSSPIQSIATLECRLETTELSLVANSSAGGGFSDMHINLAQERGGVQLFCSVWVRNATSFDLRYRLKHSGHAGATRNSNTSTYVHNTDDRFFEPIDAWLVAPGDDVLMSHVSKSDDSSASPQLDSGSPRQLFEKASRGRRRAVETLNGDLEADLAFSLSAQDKLVQEQRRARRGIEIQATNAKARTREDVATARRGVGASKPEEKSMLKSAVRMWDPERQRWVSGFLGATINSTLTFAKSRHSLASIATLASVQDVDGAKRFRADMSSTVAPLTYKSHLYCITMKRFQDGNGNSVELIVDVLHRSTQHEWVSIIQKLINSASVSCARKPTKSKKESRQHKRPGKLDEKVLLGMKQALGNLNSARHRKMIRRRFMMRSLYVSLPHNYFEVVNVSIAAASCLGDVLEFLRGNNPQSTVFLNASKSQCEELGFYRESNISADSEPLLLQTVLADFSADARVCLRHKMLAGRQNLLSLKQEVIMMPALPFQLRAYFREEKHFVDSVAENERTLRKKCVACQELLRQQSERLATAVKEVAEFEAETKQLRDQGLKVHHDVIQTLSKDRARIRLLKRQVHSTNVQLLKLRRHLKSATDNAGQHFKLPHKRRPADDSLERSGWSKNFIRPLKMKVTDGGDGASVSLCDTIELTRESVVEPAITSQYAQGSRIPPQFELGVYAKRGEGKYHRTTIVTLAPTCVVVNQIAGMMVVLKSSHAHKQYAVHAVDCCEEVSVSPDSHVRVLLSLGLSTRMHPVNAFGSERTESHSSTFGKVKKDRGHFMMRLVSPRYFADDSERVVYTDWSGHFDLLASVSLSLKVRPTVSSNTTMLPQDGGAEVVVNVKVSTINGVRVVQFTSISDTEHAEYRIDNETCQRTLHYEQVLSDVDRGELRTARRRILKTDENFEVDSGHAVVLPGQQAAFAYRHPAVQVRLLQVQLEPRALIDAVTVSLEQLTDTHRNKAKSVSLEHRSVTPRKFSSAAKISRVTLATNLVGNTLNLSTETSFATVCDCLKQASDAPMEALAVLDDGCLWFFDPKLENIVRANVVAATPILILDLRRDSDLVFVSDTISTEDLTSMVEQKSTEQVRVRSRSHLEIEIKQHNAAAGSNDFVAAPQRASSANAEIANVVRPAQADDKNMRPGGGLNEQIVPTNPDTNTSSGEQLQLCFLHLDRKAVLSMSFPNEPSEQDDWPGAELGLLPESELQFIEWKQAIGHAIELRLQDAVNTSSRTRFLSSYAEFQVVGDKLTRVLKVKEYLLKGDVGSDLRKSVQLQYFLHLPRIEIASIEMTNYAMAWAGASQGDARRALESNHLSLYFLKKIFRECIPHINRPIRKFQLEHLFAKLGCTQPGKIAKHFFDDILSSDLENPDLPNRPDVPNRQHSLSRQHSLQHAANTAQEPSESLPPRKPILHMNTSLPVVRLPSIEDDILGKRVFLSFPRFKKLLLNVVSSRQFSFRTQPRETLLLVIDSLECSFQESSEEEKSVSMTLGDLVLVNQDNTPQLSKTRDAPLAVFDTQFRDRLSYTPMCTKCFSQKHGLRSPFLHMCASFTQSDKIIHVDSLSFDVKNMLVNLEDIVLFRIMDLTSFLSSFATFIRDRRTGSLEQPMSGSAYSADDASALRKSHESDSGVAQAIYDVNPEALSARPGDDVPDCEKWYADLAPVTTLNNDNAGSISSSESLINIASMEVGEFGFSLKTIDTSEVKLLRQLRPSVQEQVEKAIIGGIPLVQIPSADVSFQKFRLSNCLATMTALQQALTSFYVDRAIQQLVVNFQIIGSFAGGDMLEQAINLAQTHYRKADRDSYLSRCKLQRHGPFDYTCFDVPFKLATEVPRLSLNRARIALDAHLPSTSAGAGASSLKYTRDLQMKLYNAHVVRCTENYLLQDIESSNEEIAWRILAQLNADFLDQPSVVMPRFRQAFGPPPQHVMMPYSHTLAIGDFVINCLLEGLFRHERVVATYLVQHRLERAGLVSSFNMRDTHGPITIFKPKTSNEATIADDCPESRCIIITERYVIYAAVTYALRPEPIWYCPLSEVQAVYTKQEPPADHIWLALAKQPRHAWKHAILPGTTAAVGSGGGAAHHASNDAPSTSVGLDQTGAPVYSAKDVGGQDRDHRSPRILRSSVFVASASGDYEQDFADILRTEFARVDVDYRSLLYTRQSMWNGLVFVRKRKWPRQYKSYYATVGNCCLFLFHISGVSGDAQKSQKSTTTPQKPSLHATPPSTLMDRAYDGQMIVVPLSVDVEFRSKRNKISLEKLNRGYSLDNVRGGVVQRVSGVHNHIIHSLSCCVGHVLDKN